jgi:peptidoglycan biosynthesis protein MviN/MurJ (putative lipid II flippase)
VIGQALRRLKPLLVGTAYYKMEPAVDRYLASMAGAGGLSLLYLAQLAYGAGSQVLNAAVTVPTVPLLARQAQQGQWALFRSTYRRRTALALITSTCAVAFVAIAGHSILRLTLGNRLQPAEVQRLWWLLLALAGVLLGGATGQILASTFYAKGDTLTPTRIGVVGFTIGIVLKIAGFTHFGLIGLAMATSVYYVLNAATEFVVLERLHGVEGWSRK